MTCHYAPLDNEALLHIKGPDTLSFLQGQTTCDTRKIDQVHALPGAYCTPQGRVVCDFLLCQLGDEHYALRMRGDIVAASAATFGKYIIFSKAELEAGRDDWQVVACWGAQARENIHNIFGTAPDTQFDCITGEGFVVVQVDEAGRQFECYLDRATGSPLRARMEETLSLSEQSAWETLQISAGIARIEAATVEEFVPQMLNYDLTGHISFDKGCYTGQEVVARLHYRGKPKRRMYVTRMAASELVAGKVPDAGTALFGAAGEQSIGNIVNSALTAGGDLLALAVATTAGAEQGLHLGNSTGPLLTQSEQPYAVEPG